jgi:hypothetical protein
MNNDSKCDKTTPKAVENTAPLMPGGRRRRFLGASIAVSTTVATPKAIATITSQPTLGTTCFTPSRSLSKNTSISQQGKYGECNGVSPGNYMTQTDTERPATNWPNYPQPTTKFHDVFAEGPYGRFYNSNGTKMTMMDVLRLSGRVDPDKVAFHIIGAYLNQKNGYLDQNITAQTILNIWSEYAQKKSYTPFAGADAWFGTDIVFYLKSNKIVG